MISDSKKGELGTNVMMKELGFIQGGDMFVENEIVELQSKNLMREVIKDWMIFSTFLFFMFVPFLHLSEFTNDYNLFLSIRLYERLIF